jgi:membrane associated rhomboid family serine protease
MRIEYNAPVVLTFSVISTLVLVLDRFLGGMLIPYFSIGGQFQPESPFFFSSLLTHVIGHANLEHLLGNLTFILLLGPIVEEKYGSRNTLYMILITAVITGLLNVIFFNTGLMGASGIVFMLILLASFTNSRKGSIPLTFLLIAILFIGKEVFQSIQDDNISQFAHIIGGILGSVFGFSGIFKKPTGYQSS